jgi:DNA-binding beta-propeller fold protein YncE
MSYKNHRLNRIATCLFPGLILALPVWSQIISTVAGSSTWNGPVGVRLDAGGNLYVPDFNNHVVYKIDSTGAATVVAGTYQKAGFSGDGGLAT